MVPREPVLQSFGQVALRRDNGETFGLLVLASADSYRFTTDMHGNRLPGQSGRSVGCATAHPGHALSGEPTMHPDAPLWVSLLLLPAFAARGVWRVLRSGDGVALAMLIASWFIRHRL